MKLERYQIATSNYTIDEIAGFIKARTGYEPEGHKAYIDNPFNKGASGSKQRRKAYIKTLRHLEQSATFPLLKLPAELRLRVYRGVLIEDPAENCSAILRDPYDERFVNISAHIHFRQHTTRPNPESEFALINIGKKHSSGMIAWHADLPKLLSIIKPFANIRNLHITAETHDDPVGFMPADIHTRYLISNVFFLVIIKEFPSLQRVEVSFRDGRFLEFTGCKYWKLATVRPLTPLMRLGGECNLKLLKVKRDVEEAFWRMAAKTKHGGPAGRPDRKEIGKDMFGRAIMERID